MHYSGVNSEDETDRKTSVTVLQIRDAIETANLIGDFRVDISLSTIQHTQTVQTCLAATSFNSP